MSQSELFAGGIFNVDERRHGILDTSLNAKFASAVNGNVSTISRLSLHKKLYKLIIKSIKYFIKVDN